MGSYSKNLRSRIDVFGKKTDGYCAICGNFGSLSADHVPPKSCVKMNGPVKDVILQTLMPKEDGQKFVVQGGVKFNSICNDCNNNLLGATYDPALNDFVSQTFDQIRQRSGRIALSPNFSVSIQPNKVIRAVFGHLIAAHSVPETLKSRQSLGAGETLRQYLLDPTSPFPKNWRVYCWPYLGNQQIIAKHILHADFSVPAPNNVYGHIIKFFPLGFWFVHDQPEKLRIFTYEITPDTGSGLEDFSPVYFDLRNIPTLGFPEHPTGNQVMLMADSHTSVASPR